MDASLAFDALLIETDVALTQVERWKARQTFCKQDGVTTPDEWLEEGPPDGAYILSDGRSRMEMVWDEGHIVLDRDTSTSVVRLRWRRCALVRVLCNEIDRYVRDAWARQTACARSGWGQR